MDFNDLEAIEGLRCSWHVWPSSRIEASRCVIPFGVVYTPLHHMQQQPQQQQQEQPSIEVPLLPYPPLRCKACESVLNSFCSVDYPSKIWGCPICHQRNRFPPTYDAISETNIPTELFPQHCTVEYALQEKATGPLSLIFLVDLCMPSAELAAVKSAISHLLSLLPDSTPVALLTFSRHVIVHDLSFEHECGRAVMFTGDKETKGQRLLDLLQSAAFDPTRFLLPLTDVSFSLTSALEDLVPDATPVEPGFRAQRATGAALSLAVSLLELALRGGGGGGGGKQRVASSSISSSPSRLLLFTSGPSTVGPGLVVDTDLAEPIRTHHDISADQTVFFRNSSRFYSSLAQRMVDVSCALDLFAGSLDQVGAAEMKDAMGLTGGTILLAETFECEQFTRTLLTLLETDAKGHFHRMHSDAVLRVFCPHESIRIHGAIGPCCSLRSKSPCVSESEIGAGGTCEWRFPFLSPSTSVALYFEIVNPHTNPIPSGQSFFLQFTTQYLHSDGSYRLRVLTIPRRWVEPQQLLDVAAGFDQEAAAVLLARTAALKSEREEAVDILRWLDRLLIRLAAKFGEYEKDDPSSFRFASNFALFPQFLFHFRRSQFLQTSNCSPDETTFFRLSLFREAVPNSIVMIQPSLLAYSLPSPPRPVLLDVASLAPDCALLFDSFFCVLVHFGSSLVQWRREGYHNDPAHKSFRDLLEMPVADAHDLLLSRLPIPRLVICDQHGSQARFLLARLNPSISYSDSSVEEGGADVAFTDDVSLETFMQHLTKLAVQM